MNNLPQVSCYQILLRNNQIISESIENIEELDDIIMIYGRDIINTITFGFYDRKYNIILENSEINSYFRMKFSCCINQCSVYGASTSELLEGYSAIMNCLESCNNLNDTFGKYIIKPL